MHTRSSLDCLKLGQYPRFLFADLDHAPQNAQMKHNVVRDLYLYLFDLLANREAFSCKQVQLVDVNYNKIMLGA